MQIRHYINKELWLKLIDDDYGDPLQWIDIPLRLESHLLSMDHMALSDIVPSHVGLSSVPQKGWSLPHPRKLIFLTHSLLHQGFLSLALSYPSDFSVLLPEQNLHRPPYLRRHTLFKETHTQAHWSLSHPLLNSFRTIIFQVIISRIYWPN